MLNMKLKKNLLICFIHRKGSVIIPSGQDSIQVGDTVMIGAVIAMQKEADALLCQMQGVTALRHGGIDIYRGTADIIIDGDGTVEETAEKVLEELRIVK